MRPEPRRSIVAALALFAAVMCTSKLHADIFDTLSSVSLYPPPNATTDTGTEDNQQRGIYITAIKDFQLCGIGFGVTLAAPGTLTVAVYAAHGDQSTLLLADASLYTTDTGTSFHSVPIGYTLEACKDYDIRVGWQDAVGWPYANEPGATLPYDAGGVIRVRDGEANGGAAAGDRIPNIVLLGESVGPSTLMGLDPPVALQSCDAGVGEQRGIYLTPTKTVSICAIGFDVGGQTAPYFVQADIYEATGTTRGNSIARGVAKIATTNFAVHRIPINAVLLEGHDYDISITVPDNGSYRCISESAISLPYFVDATIEVRDGESQGNAGNTIMPNIQIHYNLGVAPLSIDLSKPPTDTSTTAINHGLFVTSLTDLDIFSVGWNSAVPSGATITARIYEATGTTRGALVSEGTVQGKIFGGWNWHDIPIAARLATDQDYDIEIAMSTVDEWGYWQKVTLLPYFPMGLLQVTSPETNGNAGATNKVIELRVGACEAVSSAVRSERALTPAAVYLSAPTPNPVTGVSTIAYQLQEPEPIEIALYDVAGRKVSIILNTHAAGLTGVVSIDATGLASGIYFAKLTTPSASVARKVLIVK